MITARLVTSCKVSLVQTSVIPTRQEARTQGSWLPTFGIALGLVVLLEGVALLCPPASVPRYTLNLTASAGSLIFTLAAIVSSLEHFPTARERRGWLVIGLAILLKVVADLVWIFNLMVLRRELPFPALPDLFHLASYVPLWIGLLLQPGQPVQERYGRLVVMIEMFITIIAALSLLWWTSIGPTLQADAAMGRIEKLLILTYPVLDLGTLTVVIALLFRSRIGAFLGPRALLTGGVLILAFVDTAFSYKMYYGTYHSGDWLDALWPFAYVFVGVAAMAQARAYRQHATLIESSTFPPSRLHVVIPYVLVVIAGIAALRSNVHYYHQRPEEVGLIVGTISVFFLIIVRQWITYEENRRLYQKLHDAYHEMAQLAQTDPITKLPNYRQFMERLELEVQRAARYQSSVALIFADLDFFKIINDTCGHRAGDLVLRHVGHTLKGQIRAIDFLARYGGEEFVILLPQTTLHQATLLARRLRVAVEELKIPLGIDDTHTLTISLGVAAFPSPSPTAENLVNDADAAMYYVKNNGRNGVHAAYERLNIRASATHDEAGHGQGSDPS